MKFLPCIFAGLMLVASAAAQAGSADDWRNPTTAKYGLRGPVKMFRVERLEPNGERFPTQQCTFDQQSHALEYTEFDYQKHGEVTHRTVFHYDGSGNSVGSDTYDRYSGFEHPQTTTFTLDGLGRRIEQRVIQADGKPGTRFTYKFDGRGNLIEEAWYSWQDWDTPVGVTKNTYDWQGHLTDQEYKDDHGPNLGWKTHHEYNQAGQLVRTQQHRGDVLDATIVFTYDDKGRKASATTVTSNRDFWCDHCPKDGRVTYAYDAAGRVTEQTSYDAAGQVKELMRQGYDEFGNPTQQDAMLTTGSNQVAGKAMVNGEPITIHWSNGLRHTGYTYDSHGNWTKAEETSVPQFDLKGPRKVSFTTFRTIEYF